MTTLVTPVVAPVESKAKLKFPEKLCAIVQTIPGRLALVLIFTVLLKATRVAPWWETGILLALLSVLPGYRKQLLILGAIGWIFVSPPLLINPLYPDQFARIAERQGALSWIRFLPGGHIGGGLSNVLIANAGLLIAVAVVFMFAFTYTWCARNFPKSILGQRPVTGLIVLMLVLLGVQSHLSGALWFAVATFELILGHYIWFFAYTLSEPRSGGKSPPIQIGYWRYFWAVNKCPIGKGAQYLDRVVAKNDEEFAKTQISGMKLLLWAVLLTAVRVVASNWLFGPRGESLTRIPGWHPEGWLPTFDDALHRAIVGNPYPWSLRWPILIAHFSFLILELAIWGHKLVAIARMAGFNIFRNMYRPMTSVSIAEFYNRFHWYFKEMLVTFFFFPTYLRYFKKWPRLRIFFATVAAAGFGNYIYHFLHYDRNIYEYGLWKAFIDYHPYAVYTTFLALGIGISQFRAHGAKKERPTGFRKFAAIMSVMLFFCLMSVFDEGSTMRKMSDYWAYWVGLFVP